jgi:hypothetical protein
MTTCLPAATGCSLLIATSGKDVLKYETRDEVHAEFGEPTASGIEDGEYFEEYHTRRKIVGQPDWLWTLKVGIYGTYGLVEFIAFPAEAIGLGETWIAGRTLRFNYDIDGNRTSVFLDGLQYTHRELASREELKRETSEEKKEWERQVDPTLVYPEWLQKQQE